VRRHSPSCLRSALYEGTVTHRRAEPAHRFDSQVALPLLFLDELAGLRAVHPLADLDPSPHRSRWPAAIRFHREDYLPSDAATVQRAVEDAVAEAGGLVRGPVAMLGHVRTWGWLFNPLTLYYCFDPAGRAVEWTVLEVSNTPWHERCTYVVGPPGEHRFAKALHVSPFLPAEAIYTLRYSEPEEAIRVVLAVDPPSPPPPPPPPYGRVHDPSPKRVPPQLAASMVLRRRPLDRAGMARLLWAHPFMTARVSGRIYAQALGLAARGAPLYRHPARADETASVVASAGCGRGGRPPA
jgi:uncharacterized protein